MTTPRDNPLIVQSDHTVLAEVDSPRFPEARDRLLPFAELVKSPEHVHTYRITPLSIWNARAAGLGEDEILATLEEFGRYAVPENVRSEIAAYAGRFGRVRLIEEEGALLLEVDDTPLAERLARQSGIGDLLGPRRADGRFDVPRLARGRVKQALVELGYPAEDLAGYAPGEPLALALRPERLAGGRFELRDYQHDAVDAFHAGGSARGGSGVVVLPCGAGKTVVGMGAMAELETSTLILTTSVTAVRQWRDELLDKTTLTPEEIGEYSGAVKEVRPVTISTYQMLTHRPRRGGPFPHMEIFDERNWGLVIYDEVHLLPAPVFQVTAGLQARRRLGLTATLVREDGREGDVFALIGPKKVDVPWRLLERQGWVAEATCTEVRVDLPEDLRMGYALAKPRERFRMASENPAKLGVVRSLLDSHPGEPTLLLAAYVDQIRALAKALDIPVLTGTTAQSRRDQLFADFREGRLPALALSKVGNFAVDLPDASVAIQVSGTFGSRQEEAQRLGRVLRPKSAGNQAHFYTLVSRDTVEQEFAMKRQLFLCEQGYEYQILDPAELEASPA